MRRAVAAALATLSLVVGAMAGSPDLHAANASPTRGTGTIVRPPITWKLIPFGAKRKDQMAAYSKRHYGKRTYVLGNPHVIVEHYTDGTSFSSAWNTFAANSKHLGEYPGTCAQFIIDTDGTIYQLVHLSIRCRHAIGMNYTSIGIEHVGTSDEMVLNNAKQMRSSLRLTLWLMQRDGISIGNVIGHAETLQSPYHHELYTSWQCLTHADFPHWAMHDYRQRIRTLATRRGIAVGAPPMWVDNGC
jgi:N-acetyl-anhydromuramyl-L-alanine amidase AmpD